MTLEDLRSLLGWCLVLDLGLLLLWAVAFLGAGNSIHRLHGKFFSLSRESFDALHYGLIAAFKLGVLLFHLVPYLALRILA